MKSVYLSFMLSLSSMTSAWPVYIVDGDIVDSQGRHAHNRVRTEEISNDNSTFQDSCVVYCNKKNGVGESYGTGTFISENVVLTARHVICDISDKDKYNLTAEKIKSGLVSPEYVKIELNKRIFEVVETHIYKDGFDDVALLVLKPYKEPLPFRVFKTILSVQKNESMPNVTVMGYGRGGVINKDRIFYQDEDSSFFGPYFRYQENVNDLEIKKYCWEKEKLLPTGELNSKFVKSGSGDSGSSLLNQDGHIIGVLNGGNRAFDDRIDDLNKKINDKRLEELNSKSFLKSILDQENYILNYMDYLTDFTLSKKIDLTDVRLLIDNLFRNFGYQDYSEYLIKKRMQSIFLEK